MSRSTSASVRTPVPAAFAARTAGASRRSGSGHRRGRSGTSRGTSRCGCGPRPAPGDRTRPHHRRQRHRDDLAVPLLRHVIHCNTLPPHCREERSRDEHHRIDRHRHPSEGEACRRAATASSTARGWSSPPEASKGLDDAFTSGVVRLAYRLAPLGRPSQAPSGEGATRRPPDRLAPARLDPTVGAASTHTVGLSRPAPTYPRSTYTSGGD